MNLRDNNRVRTLDSRTFVECSRRMQICHPKDAELIQTPLGNFETIGNEGVNKDAKLDPKNGIKPPRITVKCPTPTPPPRKKRGQQPQDQEQPPVENIKITVVPEKVARSPSSTVRSVRFSSNKGKIESYSHAGHGDGHQKYSHDPVFSRPVQFIMDWMTNIANNLDCPPV